MQAHIQAGALSPSQEARGHCPLSAPDAEAQAWAQRIFFSPPGGTMQVVEAWFPEQRLNQYPSRESTES